MSPVYLNSPKPWPARWVRHCLFYSGVIGFLLACYIVGFGLHPQLREVADVLAVLLLPVWGIALLKRAIYGKDH